MEKTLAKLGIFIGNQSIGTTFSLPFATALSFKIARKYPRKSYFIGALQRPQNKR